MSEQNPLQELTNKILRIKPVLYTVFGAVVLLAIIHFWNEAGGSLKNAAGFISGSLDRGTPAEREKMKETDRIFEDKFMGQYIRYLSQRIPASHYQKNVIDPYAAEINRMGGYYNAPFSAVDKARGLFATLELKLNNVEPFNELTKEMKRNLIRYAALNQQTLSLQLDIISDGISEAKLARRKVMVDSLLLLVEKEEALGRDFESFFEEQMSVMSEKYCDKLKADITVAEKNNIARYFKKKWTEAIVAKAGEEYRAHLENDIHPFPDERIWRWLKI